MAPSDPASPIPVPTLTHARLRADQGDVEGARRVVRQILIERPDDQEALRLVESLNRRIHARKGAEPDESPEAPPEPRRAGDLAEAFRRGLSPAPSPRSASVARLEDWLRRIRERRDLAPR